MLTSLVIKNFRGIKEGKIEDISNVNILLGPNNSGKSTILESIYLASTALSKNDVLGRERRKYIMKRRVNRSYDFIDSLWYKYKTNAPITIMFRVDNKKDFLFEVFKEDNLFYAYLKTEPTRYYSRESIHANWFLHKLSDHGPIHNYHISGGITSSEICNTYGISQTIFNDLISLLETSIIIDSFISNNFELIEEKLWFTIVADRTDKKITKIINSCYDTNIENFSYVKIGPGYSLAALLPTHSVRIDEIGDGVRMAVVILALAYLTKNGILLFEEPENHQHIRALDKIMQALLEVTKTQKTQLFISTHSLELTERLVDLSIKLNIDLTVHGLSLDKGILKSRSIKKQDAKNLLEVGEDLRII
ncbi:MAG: AAA family ATPase [Candidatus Asgardarchaeia archaeon]